MRAVDQWRAVELQLPEGWQEARLTFTVEDPSAVGTAAAVLAPLGPGRSRNQLRFQVRRAGGIGGVESVRNLLGRLDQRRVWGTLELAAARVADPAEAQAARRALVDAWDEALATLPPDWSDLLCELEVRSSDHLPRAALLTAPLNPARVPERRGFRFRVSRGGYGAPPALARRCLELMDDEGITGWIRIDNALSQTSHVATQGPVWRVGGRAV
jgi:hypothetical protein